MSDLLTKHCSACCTEKTLDCFFAKKGGKHGRSSKCSDCTIQYSAEWRANNQARIKALSLDYYSRTRDEHLTRASVWQKENPERAQERNRRWKSANPDALNTMHRNRRARVANAPGSHTAQDIENLKLMQRYRCAACAASIRDAFHVDHREPLALGGSNDKANLQLLCPTCNMSKGARDPVAFMQSRGFLL